MFELNLFVDIEDSEKLSFYMSTNHMLLKCRHIKVFLNKVLYVKLKKKEKILHINKSIFQKLYAGVVCSSTFRTYKISKKQNSISKGEKSWKI